MAAPLLAQPPAPVVVEIRSYNLKPGTRERFQATFLRAAMPLLQRAQVDVVAYGPSLHDRDSFYLIREYASVEERQRSEDAFYGSAAWIDGPRAAILADIDSYTTIVVQLDPAAADGLRTTSRGAAMPRSDSMPTSADLATLASLNDDYIQSVQRGDVARFTAILADDFLASMPDGAIVNKTEFLAQTARPVTITGLRAHDVNVRLLGEVAIIHARTTFTTQDGRAASGRYTDVWARRNGQWLAVSAHVTRN